MIKKILIALVGLVALILLIPFFMASRFQVTRTIEISKPPESIFPLLVNYKSWPTWSPWYEMDKNAKNTFSEPDGIVGAKMAWEGEIVGKGYQQIEEIIENKKVKSKLVFEKPDPMESTAIFLLEPTSSGTKIIWINEGKLDYPVGRLFGPFLDSMIGPDFEKGLSKLKSQLEK
jgi:hypothetical protein